MLVTVTNVSFLPKKARFGNFYLHSSIQASSIFTYGIASDPPPPPHDSLSESVTSKGNTKQHVNTFNTVPSDQDSDPSLSDYSLSESSDSSYNEY